MKVTGIVYLFLALLLSANCSSLLNPPPTDIPLLQATIPSTTVEVNSTGSAVIALVMKTLTNPFFVEMEKGARQAEQDFQINLIVKTAAQETSIEQQIEIVDELITAQVDAIVIAPGDSIELIPILKKAQDAGIIIINIDNQLDLEYAKTLGLKDVPFISVDNVQGAYLSAQYISHKITQPTKAVIIEGIRSAKNAQQRKAGALRAFGENPNISVVATESANWKIDEGYQVTKAMFTETPDIGAIFCANDMMALGAIQYLEENNQIQNVLVAAYDALDQAKEAIAAGKLAVTIDQQAARQGYLGVEYAVKALNGFELPTETMIEVLVVDQDGLN